MKQEKERKLEMCNIQKQCNNVHTFDLDVDQGTCKRTS
jgi:hypothetical protein